MLSRPAMGLPSAYPTSSQATPVMLPRGRTTFHVVILMDVTLHGTLLPKGTNEAIRTVMWCTQHLFLCVYPGPWTSPLSHTLAQDTLEWLYHCLPIALIPTACHRLRREPRVTWHLLFTLILVPSLNTTLAFWAGLLNIQVLRCGAGKMAQALKGLVV